MEEKKRFKQILLKLCFERVNTRFDTIVERVISNQKALESETKSSAGDKHETGRAMLQLEIEKASQQFQVVKQMKEVLQKISYDKKVSDRVTRGSVVQTSGFTYFLAVSLGEIEVENKKVFAVSLQSPIGNLLMGKKEGDLLTFNGRAFTILNIS